MSFQSKYFTTAEFDSPDMPGSGVNMNQRFIARLDNARTIAGIPFVVNKGGGYRTKAHNDSIYARQGKKPTDSAHLRGLGADISTPDSTNRHKVLTAVIAAGFKRIGIGRTFIHVDDDDSLPQNVVWHYYPA